MIRGRGPVVVGSWWRILDFGDRDDVTGERSARATHPGNHRPALARLSACKTPVPSRQNSLLVLSRDIPTFVVLKFC